MTARLDVVLSPKEPLPPDVDIWLVVDILRATTTITTFLELGGKRVIPVTAVDDARELKAQLGDGWLLMGERGGLPPDGFDFGNSPLKLTVETVSRADGAVMTTTNGTASANYAAETGKPVYLACARNRAAVVDAILNQGERYGILCAGRDRQSALDDAACAGLYVFRLLEEVPGLILNDAAKMALAAIGGSEQGFAEAVAKSTHAGIIRDMGFQDDIDYCCEVDSSEVVPVKCVLPIVSGRLCFEDKLA